MSKIFNHTANKQKRRDLRQRATNAETLLWSLLRNRRFLGFKFRRQFSVGPYVLDFYCPEIKLAIEVDGSSHNSEEAQERDRIRQSFVEGYGIRFLRIKRRCGNRYG